MLRYKMVVKVCLSKQLLSHLNSPHHLSELLHLLQASTTVQEGSPATAFCIRTCIGAMNTLWESSIVALQLEEVLCAGCRKSSLSFIPKAWLCLCEPGVIIVRVGPQCLWPYEQKAPRLLLQHQCLICHGKWIFRHGGYVAAISITNQKDGQPLSG